MRAARVVGRCESTVHRAWWKRVGGGHAVAGRIRVSSVDRLATAAAPPRAQDQGATRAQQRQRRARAVQMRVASIRLGPCAHEAGWLERVCCVEHHRDQDVVYARREPQWIVRMGTSDLCLGENSGAACQEQRRTAGERPTPRHHRDEQARKRHGRAAARRARAGRSARKEIGSRQAWRMEKPRPEKGGRESHTFIRGRNIDGEGRHDMRAGESCLLEAEGVHA